MENQGNCLITFDTQLETDVSWQSGTSQTTIAEHSFRSVSNSGAQFVLFYYKFMGRNAGHFCYRSSFKNLEQLRELCFKHYKILKICR